VLAGFSKVTDRCIPLLFSFINQNRFVACQIMKVIAWIKVVNIRRPNFYVSLVVLIAKLYCPDRFNIFIPT
jgi:predicted metal-dependent hydrolase